MFTRKFHNSPARRFSAALAVPALVGAAVFSGPAVTAVAAITATTAIGVISATPAAAAPLPAEPVTVDGPDGQQLTVSETSLDPEGATVTVTGSGYREDVGVYVALCVVPEEGETPGPCLGGVNMSGEAESSIWMSSNPPAYAEGLTVPFEDGGSFEVSLTVNANDGHTDCLDPAVAPNGCAVSTRADHTRENDRSADVLIPVTFDGSNASDPDATPDTPGTDEPEATPEPETDSGEVSDDVQNEDATESEPEAAPDASDATDSDAQDKTDEAGNSAGLTILIIIVVLGVIVGATAVVFANRKKRQAARAAALNESANESTEAAADHRNEETEDDK